jgi:predicted phosphodiesterase
MRKSFPLVRADRPLLVFGGPYSNLEATQAVLSAAAQLSISRERVICTGDIVAYCADPTATVRLIRDTVPHVVMGNCEESLAAGAVDCGCGFPANSECQRLSDAWFMHADRQLGSDERSWMAQLPRRIGIELNGIRLAIVHGGVTAINQFIFASTDAKIKDRELDRARVDGIVGGHCGLPFTQIIDGRLWHNAGAIGMPANDGTPRVWFSILSPFEDGISIAHRAIYYDHRNTAAKMRQAGLPEGYATALANGLWPSCDVLPPKELCERGVPLKEGSTIFWQPIVRTSQSRPLRRPITCEQLWPRPDRNNIPRPHQATA